MATQPTHEQRLKRIGDLRDQLDEAEAARDRIRTSLLQEIRETLPPPGEEGPRGVITDVVKASRWTRAQVDLVRKGKVKTTSDE